MTSLISLVNLLSLKSSLSVMMSLLWTGSRASSSHIFSEHHLSHWQWMMEKNQAIVMMIGYDLISIVDFGQMRTQRTGSRTSSTHMFPVQQGIQLICWQGMMKRSQGMLMVHGQQVLPVVHLRRMRTQRWPDSVYVSRFWMHYYSEWWYLRRQPHFVRAEDNSAMLVMGNNEEEARDNDDSLPSSARPAGPASPPTSEDEDSEVGIHMFS
ncbi:uncharacterized protein LOC121362616 [Pyrgilauda ruficollis]|uniref:uncharacterized protein LOC121362616 n=1 Tax=Pyrgilauda ruficollis TaxID=221976 RepID=UPI001B85C7CB|nr:uncharacterized protein LOC121362616 [Pyrgilauda ruficollis]